MSITDSSIPTTPTEHDEETDTVRCAECGTAVSRVQGRPEWCVVCAQPIDPPDDHDG